MWDLSDGPTADAACGRDTRCSGTMLRSHPVSAQKEGTSDYLL